ncbi:MAG: hypothetical protein GC129_04290 [Proteobacteria bacterium]|nr:hypothetical protein [Pseudomonadota bacterium]
MKDWQRKLWEEVVERHPVLPAGGGALLVVGDKGPAEFLAGDLIVAHCGWGEKPAKGLAYDRVLLVADARMPDAQLALAQVGELMKVDGQLVIVAGRGWPWGAKGTVWGNGMSVAEWKKLLRAAGWKLTYKGTAGFGRGPVPKWLPEFLAFGGMVRVMVARRGGKGGGTKVVVGKTVVPGAVAAAG